ncbi:MAG: bifunctional adenosylcobinamide kinase/adenosylcobinamide-phosphate guanylyltransferase [Chitinivibrionales bacterium]|nr:bifunctional adenosylcobinamide kinase/adenosylcobinamide-phosphate guanylyltransferase [Chitinivibrionales bacterium]
MARITMLTGGARSGKSALALELAERYDGQRAFVATAEITDDEMRQRVNRHRLERGPIYLTFEEPLALGEALGGLPPAVGVAVVDCLTVWLGNVYHYRGEDEETVGRAIDELLAALEHVDKDLILVTNEVGWGIVPENALARSFRDMAGRLNRLLAARADTVCLVCAGIPLVLKGELP